MYSGFMPIEKNVPNNEGSLFFWLVKKRQPEVEGEKKRIVVWLNGGKKFFFYIDGFDFAFY